MSDFIFNLVKTIHIVAVISWMAGMLYLPRIFVYHAAEQKGSSTSETFKIMEKKLLRYIMTPAMIVVWITGFSLAVSYGFSFGWIHTKILLVLGLSGFHGWLAARRRDFENDQNGYSERCYRIVNEIPTVLMIGIVAVIVFKF